MPPSTNIKNMFGNWLNGINNKTKSRIRVGVSTLCWSIWKSRNNVIFSNVGNSIFMQLIHMATHWIQECFFLLPRTIGNLWLLNAIDCWWSLGISSARLVGGFLGDWLMSSHVAFILFRWLIFVSTLCDPSFVIILLLLQTSKFFNKWPCASHDAEAGFSPFRKKQPLPFFLGAQLPFKMYTLYP
jgi:hypothetical protein